MISPRSFFGTHPLPGPTFSTLIRLMLLAVMLLAFGSSPALAQSDEELDRQTREIAKDMRCPVCSNLSVADSPSQLAGDMRKIIRQKLAEGQSREQIEAYFVERYPNDGILLNPPKRGFNLLMWGSPVLALLASVLLLGWTLTRWSSRKPAQLPPPSEEDMDEYEELLQEDMRQLRGTSN